MIKTILFVVFISSFTTASAQRVDSIFFNLYTDSLKKGFYNYINVDGKLADGSWMPLDSSHIKFSSNAGIFYGNDLFLDSSWTEETVKVKAELRSNPRIKKEVVIYIRKRGFNEPLQTREEILRSMERGRKKKG